jgi:hypothetical protein
MAIVLQLTDKIDPNIQTKLAAIVEAATAGGDALAALQTKLDSVGGKGLTQVVTSTSQVIKTEQELAKIVADTSLVLARKDNLLIKTASDQLNYNEAVKLGGIANYGLASAAQILAQETSKASQEVAKVEAQYEKYNQELLRSAEITALTAEKQRAASLTTAAEQDKRNNIQLRGKVIEEALAVSKQRKAVAEETFNTQQQKTFTAITQGEIAYQRLTTATNAAAGSINKATTEAINEDRALAQLNITLANQAVAQKNAVNVGAKPATVIREDFQPTRDTLNLSSLAVQNQVRAEQQLALYRIENEGATLAEIRAEQQLYGVFTQSTAALQRVAVGEADVAISRSKAVEAAISEEQAIAKLNIVQAQSAIAQKEAVTLGAVPVLSTTASFQAEKQALDELTGARQRSFQAQVAEGSVRLQEGTLTLQQAQNEAQLAAILQQTNQAIQQVAVSELSLVSAKQQSIDGVIRQQQAIVQLNQAEAQLAIAQKKVSTEGVNAAYSTASTFEAEHKALEGKVEATIKASKAQLDLLNVQIKSKEVTEEQVVQQGRLARELLIVAQAANAAAHAELDLQLKQDAVSSSAIGLKQKEVDLAASELRLKQSMDQTVNGFVLNAGVARELFVLFREAGAGSVRQLEGSIIVLANRLGIAQAAVEGITAPAKALLTTLHDFGEVGPTFQAVAFTATALYSALALVGAAVYTNNQDFKEFQATVALTGNRLGLTQKSFEDLAESIASRSSISVRQAKENLTELTKTGDFTKAQLESLTEDAGKYSKLTQETSAEATKALGQSFAQGADGILKLNQRFPFLQEQTAIYIASHRDLSDKTDITNRALTDFHTKISSLKDPIAAVTSNIDLTRNSLSNLFNDIANAAPGKFFEDLLTTFESLNRVAASLFTNVEKLLNLVKTKPTGDDQGVFASLRKQAGLAAEKPPENGVAPTNSKVTSLNIVGSVPAIRPDFKGEASTSTGKGLGDTILNPTVAQDATAQLELVRSKIKAIKYEGQIVPDITGGKGTAPLTVLNEYLDGTKNRVQNVGVAAQTAFDKIKEGVDATGRLKEKVLTDRQPSDIDPTLNRKGAEQLRQFNEDLAKSREGRIAGGKYELLTEKEIEAVREGIYASNKVRLSDRQLAEEKLAAYIKKSNDAEKEKLAGLKLLGPEQEKQKALAKFIADAPSARLGSGVNVALTPADVANQKKLIDQRIDEEPTQKVLLGLTKDRLEVEIQIEDLAHGLDIVRRQAPELEKQYLAVLGQKEEKLKDILDPIREETLEKEKQLRLSKFVGLELQVQIELEKEKTTERKKGALQEQLAQETNIKLLEREKQLRVETREQAVQKAANVFNPKAQFENIDVQKSGLELAKASDEAGKSVDNLTVEMNKLATSKDQLDLKFSDLTSFEAFSRGVDIALRPTLTANEQIANSSKALIDGTVKGFSDSLSATLTSGASFSQSFGQILQQLLKQSISSLIQIQVQALLTGKSLSTVFESLSSSGSSGGGFFSTLLSVGANLLGVGSSAPLTFGSADLTSAGAGLGQGLKLPPFGDGGFTGNLGADQPAGVVHGQEFVVHAAATAKNRAQLEALNRTGQLPQNQNQRSVVNVSIDNSGTYKNFEVQHLSEDQIRIIAKDEANKIPTQFHDANSPLSKAYSSNFRAQRIR